MKFAALFILLCALSAMGHKRDFKCKYPKKYDNWTRSCRCPSYRNQDTCINWEEFDERSCSCYCPYSRNFKKCPSNKRWSYSECYCKCRTKKPLDGCENGRWSNSQCKCVVYGDKITTVLTTVTSRTSTVSETIISTVADPTTASAVSEATTLSFTDPTTASDVIETTIPSTVTTTLGVSSLPLTPTCSFGVKPFNDDEHINGIGSGFSEYLKNFYAAFIDVDGVKIPGGLQTMDSLMPGFSYAYRGQMGSTIRANVSYFAKSEDCSCRFIAEGDPMPANGYAVTLNSGSNLVGVGSGVIEGAELGITARCIGAIDFTSGTLSCFNGFKNEIWITQNFSRLICAPISETTTTTASTTVSSSVTGNIDYLNTKTSIIESSLDSIADQLTNLAHQCVDQYQLLASDTALSDSKRNAIGEVVALLSEDPLTYNSTVSARRKRQVTATDDCGFATSVAQKVDSYLNAQQPRYLYYNSFLSRSYKIHKATLSLPLPPSVLQQLPVFNDLLGTVLKDTQDLRDMLARLKTLSSELCALTTTSVAAVSDSTTIETTTNVTETSGSVSTTLESTVSVTVISDTTESTSTTLESTVSTSVTSQQTESTTTRATDASQTSNSVSTTSESTVSVSATTESTTASESTSTTNAPPFCAFTKDLKNAFSVFLKSMCWVNQTMTYDEAETLCRSNSMQLLGVVTVGESTAFKAGLVELFGASVVTLWINGRQAALGGWYAYTPLAYLVYSADWPTSVYSQSASFLQISNSGGSFKTKAADGTARLTFVCQSLVSTQ